MRPLIPVLDYLSSRLGHYHGDGQNEAGQKFGAKLSLAHGLEGSAIELRFRAEDDESAFHEELTLITPDLLADRMCLWTISTNAPGMLKHDLVDDNASSADGFERKLVFRAGEPGDTRIFRQEITLELWPDGRIEYRYAWAVPHENLKPRVNAVLRPHS